MSIPFKMFPDSIAKYLQNIFQHAYESIHFYSTEKHKNFVVTDPWKI